MQKGLSLHELKTFSFKSVSVAGLLWLSACGGTTDTTEAALAVAGSGLETNQILQNTMTVQAGTEQAAMQAAVSTAVWTPSDQLRSDVTAYFGQLGPKAMAITPPTNTGAQAWGSIHGASSSQEAQNDALQICQNVAAQKSIGLQCVILFLENDMQRHTWM